MDNVLYVVDIYCGGLVHVVECIVCGCIYVVETVNILWGYVVDNFNSSYMLWVTVFCVVHNICWCSPQHTYAVGICCGVLRGLPIESNIVNYIKIINRVLPQP